MRILLIIALTVFASVTLNGRETVFVNFQEQKKDTLKSVYICPMHPEVVQNKQGKCPKCGMDLVAKKIVKAPYFCPMHPEITSDKPSKCPKCGMNLEIKKTPKKEESPK